MKLAALAPLLALLSHGAAQTPPPPPSCSIATIQTRVTEVNRACCVPQSICKSGTPSQCNSQCAHVFLSFYQQCYADLAGFMKEQITVFDELSKKCQVVAPKHSCLSENHAMQVLQYMECAKTQADIVHRTRCVQRALSVLGLQGSRPSNPADSCLALDVNLPLLAGTPYPPTLPPRAFPSPPQLPVRARSQPVRVFMSRAVTDVFDDSSYKRHAVTHGDAYIADGAHFDGSGDYLSISNFDYTRGGQFSIGVWFTKESCSGGIYEYLFSHAKYKMEGFSTPTDDHTNPNPNVHMYVGCEHSGGGWSNLGGTVIRFNLYDDANTAVMFDYPAWDAKSFSAVTNVWIHGLLVADKSNVGLYINGERVVDSIFGFFDGGMSAAIPMECRGNAACDQQTGKPRLRNLIKPLGTISMQTDIFIGGRMDLNADRHFAGKIAGLTISTGPMKATETKCVFTAYNGLLPALPHCDAMIAEMLMGQKFELELSLLGARGGIDTSGKSRSINKFGGDTIISSKGAVFDGDGDYLTIANFNYESDGDFTISFWITKDDCKKTNDMYEYLYSHVQNVNGAHTSIEDRLNSNVNMYIGCEKPNTDTIASTSLGTIIRFNLIDARKGGPGSWVLFDYSLSQAASFDHVTRGWVHVAMTVTRHSVHAYINGKAVKDSEVGFPTGGACDDMHIRPTCPQLTGSGAPCSTDMMSLTGGNPAYRGQTLANYCPATCKTCKPGQGSNRPTGASTNMVENIAYPYPSNLRSPLQDFDLRSPIFIGARFDLDKQRHFKGSLALLSIYSSPLSMAESHCLFMAGDATMEVAIGRHRRRLALPVIVNPVKEAGEAEQPPHHQSVSLGRRGLSASAAPRITNYTRVPELS
jgi:hypothetical protein